MGFVRNILDAPTEKDLYIDKVHQKLMRMTDGEEIIFKSINELSYKIKAIFDEEDEYGNKYYLYEVYDKEKRIGIKYFHEVFHILTNKI